MALAAVPSLASEATFDRTLTVSGRVELSVSTGSGNIRLTHGTGNQVHIFGRVKAGRGGFEENVNATAAHPPIEQTGNIIRVGSRHPTLHNMSIDYEIQAPENAYLDVSTVSGDVDDDGVGDNAKLNTGSGNIHATGLHGGFTIGTGSGNIYAEQTSQGDVKAETGSGNIELRNLRGGLKAETIETGSGGVDFWAGNAALALDAETDSGSIHTDRELAGQESSDRHHVTGKLNGGGPTVKIGSGSGNIRIH